MSLAETWRQMGEDAEKDQVLQVQNNFDSRQEMEIKHKSNYYRNYQMIYTRHYTSKILTTIITYF